MKCYLCGDKAAAKVNGVHWVCSKHALDMATESLRQGQPVVMARQGEPKYLIMPVTVGVGAQCLN